MTVQRPALPWEGPFFPNLKNLVPAYSTTLEQTHHRNRIRQNLSTRKRLRNRCLFHHCLCRWARLLPIPRFIVTLAHRPTSRRGVECPAPRPRPLPTVRRPATEGTANVPPASIRWIGEKKDAAARTARPTTTHLRMRAKRCPKGNIVPQDRRPTRARPVPVSTRDVVLLDFRYRKTSVPLMMLSVLFMPPVLLAGLGVVEDE